MFSREDSLTLRCHKDNGLTQFEEIDRTLPLLDGIEIAAALDENRQSTVSPLSERIQRGDFS